MSRTVPRLDYRAADERAEVKKVTRELLNK
jgi:hypothetical protein